MYQIFNPTGFTDKSPFQFARMDWLRLRVIENYQKLVELRKEYPGRLDSNHLLMAILQNLNVPFNGDLEDYMFKCEKAAVRLCGVMGIVSSFSKGKVFDDGVFYKDCNEIIIYARNTKYTAQDLWNDWRRVSPIEVLVHPVTSTEIVELGVLNAATLSKPGLCVISIDIPLLAAQWKMWQAGNPTGTLEAFITEVPLVSMLKSHLNVAMFNLVAEGKTIPECDIKTNLPFGQLPTDIAAKALATDVWNKITSRVLVPNQLLSSIPVFFGYNYLNDVYLSSTTPTYQVVWALLAQKMDCAALVLEVCKYVGYDRAVHEVTVIRRTLITNEQDNSLTNGLPRDVGIYLTERLDRMVTSRLPVVN